MLQYSVRVSPDVFSCLPVAVKGRWKNPGLVLGLWKHLHWKGERKVCPVSVLWESCQGHSRIVQASPVACLNVPMASKELWDQASPEGRCPLRGAGRLLPPEPGTTPPLLMQGENCLLLPARPSHGWQPPFLLALEGRLLFPGGGFEQYSNTFCAPLSYPGVLRAVPALVRTL